MPVAEVRLDRLEPTALVKGQTLQLSASAVDSVGGTLVERAVVWTSSDPAVAAIDAEGLLTGVAPGEATVTAVIEGRSASLDVGVEDGGVVTSGDSEIVAAGGAVKIFFPDGAAQPGTVIHVEPVEAAPGLPATHIATATTAYRFGPDGASFDEPVRVTLSFDPADLPEWGDPEGLAMHRWDGTQWHTLGDVDVDVTRGTVTASTSGFSDFQLTLPLPTIALSPDPGEVNDLQRSVTLTATLVGPGIAAGTDFSVFGFAWTTPGTNGTLIEAVENRATYTATIPIVPQGHVDQVTVRVTGLAADRVTVIPIGEKTVDITNSLQFTVQLTPFRQEIDFGGEATFEAIVSPSPPVRSDLRFFWQFTDNHGTWDQASGQRSTSPTIRYEAWDPELSLPNPPRIDRLDLRVILLVRNAEGDVIDERDLGTGQSFVEVAGSSAQGSWGTEINQSCAEAWIYVPKVSGAKGYSMRAHSFNDTAFWGMEITHQWTAAFGFGVTDDGDRWKFFLSSSCGADPPAAIPWMQSRFGGMVVDVVIQY